MFVVSIIAIIFVYLIAGGIVTYLIDSDEVDMMTCIFWPGVLFIGGAVCIGVCIANYFKEKRRKRLLKGKKNEAIEMKKRGEKVKVPKINWVHFDKNNPPTDLVERVEYLILLREDNYDNGATWRYSVDIAEPYGSYLDNFWNTTNDWDEGQRIEVLAYAETPYSLTEDQLYENSPIRYLCNGKECRQGCNNPDCKLTTKIEFAKNFKKDVDGGYTEKEEKLND